MLNGIDSIDKAPRATTTISTIAIKAGDKTRLTLAVLKSTDWVFLRVDEMQPSMLDVGRDLEEAMDLRQQHTDLMHKLQAKQSSIEELLSKADQMVADQRDPEAVVYEAMADSLGAAWKELSRQLQLRATLLNNAVEFFASVEKHNDQMDRIDNYLRHPPRAEDDETGKRIRRQNETMRLELLDTAVEVMTFGQLTIEKLREIGAFVDNEQRPRQTLDACSKIEDVMLRINDRRRRLEIDWDDRKSQLDLSQQACQLIAELQQIEDWINKNDNTLRCRTDLGDTEASSDLLLRENDQLLEEAKLNRDKANRLRHLAQQLVSLGYDDGGRLVGRCHETISRLDDIIFKAESRRQDVSAAASFFSAARQANLRLCELEAEIKSLSLSRREETLVRRHSELSYQIQHAAQPALAQGRSLVRKVGHGYPGAGGVERELAELERKVANLEELCALNKVKAMERSRKYQEFLQRSTKLGTWLAEDGEAFLYSNRDMGTTLPTVDDFMEKHRRMEEEIKRKEIDLAGFLQWAREIQGAQDDPDYEDIRIKTDDIRSRWDRLRKAIDARLDLATYYHKFHQQASKHAADVDIFEASIRARRDSLDESGRFQMEQKFDSLKPGYEELKSRGETFLVQTGLVSVDSTLNVARAQTCVKALLDHFANRHHTAAELWSEYREKWSKNKEFRSSWDNFMEKCRQYIHYVSQLRDDASLAFTHFEQSPASVAERLERALSEYMPKARMAQAELENLMRTAETLGGQGDTRREKESVVNQLIQTYQELQRDINQLEVITNMAITFFKNLHQQHDLSRMQQLVLEHEAAIDTVEQLLRFARSQGHQIAYRASQPDVPMRIRNECAKIPGLIDGRAVKWESMQTEQKQMLQRFSHAAKFEKEIAEIFDTIESLRRNIREMKSRLGESTQATQKVAQEFRDTERKVNQTDVRVRSILATAETLLAGPYRGHHTLRQLTDELKQRWLDFRLELDDLTKKLDAATTYGRLVEGTEEWIRDTTDYMVDVGKKVQETRTSEQASRLMGQLEQYMRPKQREQEARLAEMEKHAKILYGEHAEHKLEHHRKRYKEIVDSFILVMDQLSSLTETYRMEEMRKREREREQQRPAPVQPRFVQPLRGREVIEGGKVEFECQVTGYPKPQVQWFKDGLPIENNPDYETSETPYGVCVLNIEETFTEDTAVYTCRAINEAGVAETSAVLTVKEATGTRIEPPVFTKKLESVNVEESTSFRFECHVQGQPTPVVSWYKNEQCIDSSPYYQTSFNNGVCVLRIEETSVTDEARYSCRAINPAGEASSSARLTIIPQGGLQAPLFVTPLRNVTVQRGEKLHLECVVSGIPRPAIEWRQNNNTIRESRDLQISLEGSRVALTVPEAYPIHSGSYTVIARNRLGEATSTCLVTVVSEQPVPGLQLDPPRIAPPLQSQTIVEGNRVMFETKVTGNPKPDVSWYKDDAQLYPTPNVQILSDSYGWHRLVIKELTKQDSGAYLVRATNPAGEAKSLATLQVNVSPASRTQTSQRVIEEFYESSSGSLSGADASPSFTCPLQDIVSPLGATVRISAVIQGNPRPTVTWFFNGKPITESTGTRQLIQTGDTYSILITRLGPEHLGTYTLVAENDQGTAISTGSVNTESGTPSRGSPYPSSSRLVQRPYVEPPHFTQTLLSIVANEGEEARFEGTVTGIPAPDVKWYKDGKEISDRNVLTTAKNGHVTLRIPHVNTDHTGKYTCSAKNEGGLATSSAQLVVAVTKEAPAFIQRLISREMTEGTALQWQVKVSGDPVPRVTWMRNDVSIQPGTDIQMFDEGKGVYVLYISKLEPSHTGRITCKAENEAGEARSTADLIVRGKDEPPRVYYHVTRVYQQNHERDVEANRFHSGPLSDDESANSSGHATMGVLL